MKSSNKKDNIKLSLTADQKSTKLDKLILYETIDINLLNKLISSTLLQEITKKYTKNTFKHEREQLKKYLSLIKDGKAKIQYQRSKNINYGRVFPNNSIGLHNFRRPIRHTLSHFNYIDIDIVNCHASILHQICEANEIICNNLKNYINNRDTILNEVIEKYKISKDISKELFIRLLYFGTFDQWIKDNNISNKTPLKFITDFSNELQLIGQIIVAKNDKLKQLIEKNKNKKPHEIKGSICSYFLQNYECKILETIYLYCVDHKYIINDNAILCADGIMLEKTLYKEDLLTEFNEVIKKELGLDLKFVVKEMVMGFSIEDIEYNQI